MANSIPVWCMRSSRCDPPQEQSVPCDVPPVHTPQPEHPAPDAVTALTARLRQTDPETLLLLALLWLLWQEHADRRLILALAYIIW
ncbi:MAG: hypothetical protein J6S92_10725 [Oscillospiraceae bacterium]|nr:hypothetical protein [Oscillospiraceae bacterium]MBP0988741.1 hypothetical protein [Oscillospiraceae bacterium]MBQ5337668.1 hypothetical protein [Oscillospiraceae bacterium]